MSPEDLALLRNHILHWVHEGESLEGVSGCVRLAPLVQGGWNWLSCKLRVNVADITGTFLKRSQE